MKHFVRTPLCLVLVFFCCRPPASAQVSTVTNSPGIAASAPFTGSVFPWATPSGALAAGGSTANVASVATVSILPNTSGPTENLTVTGFGFAIPGTDIIQGITANVSRQASGLSANLLGINLSATVTDNSVQLVGTGVTSANRASATPWPSTSGNVSYGSTSDTWGATPWTPTIINNSTFGLALSANLGGSTGTGPFPAFLPLSLLPGAAVDAITIGVTYNSLTVLAVRLDQWSVVRQGSANVLSWTATVTNLPGKFIIERSSNGRDWGDLATVAAPLGQSGYSYPDNAPFASGPAYYRLRLHSDGEADGWSSIQAISTQLLQPVVTLYPNPFHDIINITSPHLFSKLSVKDLQGKTIFVKEYGNGGVSNAQIPASGLAAGIYFVRVDGVTCKLIKN